MVVSLFSSSKVVELQSCVEILRNKKLLEKLLLGQKIRKSPACCPTFSISCFIHVSQKVAEAWAVTVWNICDRNEKATRSAQMINVLLCFIEGHGHNSSIANLRKRAGHNNDVRVRESQQLAQRKVSCQSGCKRTEQHPFRELCNPATKYSVLWETC